MAPILLTVGLTAAFVQAVFVGHERRAYDRGVNRALPLLASNDTRATLAFYERLGFTSRGAPPEEWDYLIIEADGCELHFAGDTLGERRPGSAFVYAEEIDAVHERWGAAGANVTPLTHTNFGMRMFTLHDPDGNEIRVGWPPR